MNLWKVILVTGVIFGTGMVTGGLLVQRTHSKHGESPSWRHAVTNRLGQGFKPERLLRMDFVTRAREELELTPEQIVQIEAIVQESQAKTRQIWEQCSPQIRAEYKATQDKIREVLTPAHRDKFEELMKQRRPPRSEDRERPHPEAEPPPQDTTPDQPASP